LKIKASAALQRVTFCPVTKSHQKTPVKNRTPKEELHRQAHRCAILALVSRRPVHRTAKQLCIEERKAFKTKTKLSFWCAEREAKLLDSEASSYPSSSAGVCAGFPLHVQLLFRRFFLKVFLGYFFAPAKK
jgi:hypothetical protein